MRMRAPSTKRPLRLNYALQPHNASALQPAASRDEPVAESGVKDHECDASLLADAGHDGRGSAAVGPAHRAGPVRRRARA
eukprot:363764-Chlamydomonas_euryale.AAC.12